MVNKYKSLRVVGLIGTMVSIGLFISQPSWPTPDKLFVFLLFIFLTLGQSWEFFKKFAPFVVMILAYEAFRGMVPSLNSRVEYQWMIDVDKWLGGGQLPTAWLQDQLWGGSTQWYDFALYFVYMLHFVLPFALAIVIWKKYIRYYWQYVWSFISLSFMGFFTFWAFPAAPPWLAAEKGFIEPITRISSDVWWALGITDFPSLYSKISPNPVAAVPSLHAAYATLFTIFIFKIFGKKWGIISALYPSAIYFGTVYQGEHYIIDEILGGLYAVAAYFMVAGVYRFIRKRTTLNAARKNRVNKIIKSKDVGVSFSLIACHEYGIPWKPALESTIKLGFRRFRLMSYWSVIEKKQGVYDFKELDEQIKLIKKSGGSVTLAIGIRQPRWPETHVPTWTAGMSVADITNKYIAFHRAIIEHYKKEKSIESWQLENEFWLRTFGDSVDFSRRRLKHEFALLRELDPDRPIIMTLAKVVSLPLRRPTPDVYATSMYRIIYNTDKGKYTKTWTKPWIYRTKRFLIRLTKRRDLIIHELQTEPWGPKANWEMTKKEQFKSMNEEEIKKAMSFAKQSGIHYIDMWGAEWWYWRLKNHNDNSMHKVVRTIVAETNE